MDFVVVGLGVGAFAVLLGLTIRDGGGRWWPKRGGQPAADGDRRLATGRACRAGGLVLAGSGAVILAVTAAALLLGVSDRVGAILVMSAVAATVLGGIAWALQYTHRYHPRPRARTASRRYEPRIALPEEGAPSLAGTIDAGIARLGAASVVAEPAIAPAAPASEDEPIIADEALTPEPASPAPVASGADPTAPDAPAPVVDAAAPVTDVPPAAEVSLETDPDAADEPLDDAAPTRTPAYATGVNRET